MIESKNRSILIAIVFIILSLPSLAQKASNELCEDVKSLLSSVETDIESLQGEMHVESSMFSSTTWYDCKATIVDVDGKLFVPSGKPGNWYISYPIITNGAATEVETLAEQYATAFDACLGDKYSMELLMVGVNKDYKLYLIVQEPDKGKGVEWDTYTHPYLKLQPSPDYGASTMSLGLNVYKPVQ